MDLRWGTFAGILITIAITSLVLNILLWRKTTNAPGKREMIAMFTGLIFWTLGYAMITLSRSMDAKIFWLKVENIGIVSVPVTWFLFILRYTRRDKWINKISVIGLSIIPSITLILLFSGIWFHVFYSNVEAVSFPVGPLSISRGPWYYVSLVQSYALIVIGAVLLMWYLFQFRNIYRQQMAAMLLAIAIPFIFNTFYQLGSSIFPAINLRIDLTPISFTATAALLSFSIFGLHLFDLVPIARHTVLENIPEMVIVLDTQNKVVDVNFAAQQWLGKTAVQMIGQSARDVFSDWPALLERYQRISDIREEIEIPGEPPRTLEITVSGIYNRFTIIEGRIIVARDITQRKMMEDELREKNEILSKQMHEVNSLQEKLKEQAIRDPLTGLYNRRFLAEVLEKEIPKAQRNQTSLAIAIMDVDHFKNFNDRYGHKCGDMVLQKLANMLTENSRRSDIVCRYGGEEFVILMPGATLDIACERAESWRRLFETMNIYYQGQSLQATFSVGVAIFPLHASDEEALLQAADAAMYQAKVNGRNQLTIFEPGQHKIS